MGGNIVGIMMIKSSCRNILTFAQILSTLILFSSGEGFASMKGPDGNMKQTGYILGDGMVTIDTSSETVFIDYKKGLLHRFTKDSGICRDYSLFESSMNQVQAAQAQLFSEVSIIHSDETSAMQHRTEVKTVVYGARLMGMRRAVDRNLELLGTVFTPGLMDYTVDPIHQDIGRIRKIGAKHRAINGLSPLLDRIDASRLVSMLNGVVVKVERKKKVASLHYTFKDRESQLVKRQRLCSGSH